jgi:hypothetical protein
MSTKSPQGSAPKSAERSAPKSAERSDEETIVDEILEPSGPEPSGPEPSGPEPSGPEPSGNSCDCGDMANAREKLETILESKDEEYKKYFPNNLKIGINEVIDEFDLTKKQKKKLLIDPYQNKGQHGDTRKNDSLLCSGMKNDKINFLKSVINNGERYGIDIKNETQIYYLLECAMYSDIDVNYVFIASRTPFQCANYLLTVGPQLNKAHSDALIAVLDNRKQPYLNSDNTSTKQNYTNPIDKLIKNIRGRTTTGGKRNTTKRSNSKRKTKRHFKKAKSRKYRL